MKQIQLLEESPSPKKLNLETRVKSYVPQQSDRKPLENSLRQVNIPEDDSD